MHNDNPMEKQIFYSDKLLCFAKLLNLYRVRYFEYLGPKFQPIKICDASPRLPIPISFIYLNFAGNEEAAKINNFLHLTPPMIKLHTAELKKLCTPAPEKPASCLRYLTQELDLYFERCFLLIYANNLLFNT